MTLYTQEELDIAPVDQDMRLLRAYAFEGSEPAFAQLVERHGKWIYGMCRRTLHDRELAEDATQAVFLTLARKAGSMPEATRLSGWLYKATRYAIADARKRERRYRRREEVARRLAVERQERQPSQLTSESGGRLDLALAALNERDRGVILMHFFDGLTVRQMGDLLGLSREGAKKRVSRALARLRVKMVGNGSTAVTTGLAAALSAATAEAMPAGLAQAIVAAASTASVGGAAIGGAGLAAAIYRAIVQTSSIVSSNLLRGTAAAKLAGATAVVAACVIYTAPRPAAHRVAASGVIATPAALRAGGTVASVTPMGSAATPARTALVPLGSRSHATAQIANNPSEQPASTRSEVAVADETGLLSHGPARRDERTALPEPVVRGDLLHTPAAIDFEPATWRGGDDSGAIASATASTSSVGTTAVPAARLTLRGSASAGSTSTATAATMSSGSCSTAAGDTADNAASAQELAAWSAGNSSGAASRQSSDSSASSASIGSGLGMAQATFPNGIGQGWMVDVSGTDAGPVAGQVGHDGGAGFSDGAPSFIVIGHADNARPIMPAFAIADRDFSTAPAASDLTLGNCGNDESDQTGLSGQLAQLSTSDGGAVSWMPGLSPGMPSADGDIHTGDFAQRLAAPNQSLASSSQAGSSLGAPGTAAFSGSGFGIGLPLDPGGELHPLELAPEPSTLAIVAGLAGLVLRRRQTRPG
jgi:RNA polymerase sigma factor (sigma-70 family)